MSDVTNSERAKSKSLKPLKALVPYLMPYRWIMVAAALALLLASGAMLALPIALKGLIDTGMKAGSEGTIDSYFIAFLGVAVLFGVFAALRFYLVTTLYAEQNEA